MAYARANMFYERESWRKPLLISLGFHGFIVLVIVGFGFVLGPRNQTNWGENQGDAVSATLVSGAPIPIPKPETQTENIVANESKGRTETAPPPKPAETEDGISIPGQVVKPKPEKAVTANNVKAKPEKTVTATNAKPHPMPTPETAVPYGEGGPVSGPYGTFSAPNTKGGFSFQNADFGSKYGWYVDVVRRKVQNNWLLYEIDPHINAPHRAYITFDINRDGSPANIRISQSSGVPSLDISARRAIERVDTFGPLPAGNSVQVEFWFDYPPK